jgi:hypothetical protein
MSRYNRENQSFLMEYHEIARRIAGMDVIVSIVIIPFSETASFADDKQD